MTVGPDQKPPADGFYGDSWERGLDPWHVTAFPPEFQDAATDRGPERSGGWFLLDGHGEAIGFVKDGTEIPDR